ncbi:MAG: metallophosphoesterase family protein [Desulfonatronovibrionaceae bacterium]
MRIAVVSDTHMQAPDDLLAYAYENWLCHADCIIHCGDFTSAGVADFLAAHPGFRAVRGNCDHFPGSQDLPLSLEMEVCGLQVGAAHGWGRRFEVAGNVAEAFGPGLDIIFYGHTHERFQGKSRHGALLVNPGAFFQPKSGSPSLALVEIRAVPRVDFVDIE